MLALFGSPPPTRSFPTSTTTSSRLNRMGSDAYAKESGKHVIAEPRAACGDMLKDFRNQYTHREI
eukprot:8763499-Heterocapsa_arctica.AAC.1